MALAVLAPVWGPCVPTLAYSTAPDPAPQQGSGAAQQRAPRRISAFLWLVPPHRSARHRHKLPGLMNQVVHHGIDSAVRAASPDSAAPGGTAYRRGWPRHSAIPHRGKIIQLVG